VDSAGQTMEFMLAANRDAAAAKHFFRQALSGAGNPAPRVMNVDGNRLIAAQTSLRGLNANMSEQELDLLKLSACLVAQSGTVTAEIVRRNAIQTTFRGPRLHDEPYDFRTETACRDPAVLVHRPKNRADRDATSGQPVVDRGLD
jgi:hypothetical protein